MTFWNKETATFSQTDDFGWGELEAEADMKWKAGDETFVWLINDHEKPRDPTPFMFYWIGFKELNLPPLPIWFDMEENGCLFHLGDQFTKKDSTNGVCTVDAEIPKNPTLTFNNHKETTIQMHLVEDFGAGELEPDAVHKWTNGDSLWVWETAKAEHQGHGRHHKHGRLGRALSEL
jgi:hypothetical protein